MATCRPPSFFKILLDPSAPHLPLPPDFVTRHLVNKIPKNPVVRSANGEYSWRLKITKIGERYCFSDGWNNVVRDTQLRFGDFLIFRLVDQSTFQVLIYSPNGCEKDLPSKIKVEDDAVIVNDHVGVEVVDDHDEEQQQEEDDNDEEQEEEEEDDIDEEELEEDDDEDDDEDVEEYEEQIEYGDDDDIDDEDEDEDEDEDDGGGDIDGDDGDPFFTVSRTYKNMLRLPPEFVRLAGIDGYDTITMKNLDGEEWELSLRLEKSHRYYVSTGWPEFRQSNDLSEGDECVFKFIRSEGKLLLAKVIRKKRRARNPRPSDGTPASEAVKSKRRQPQPRTEGGVPETEAVKRTRRQPQPRTDGGVRATEAVKNKRGQPQPQTDGGVPAIEGVKRKRGQPQPGIDGGVSASEAVKRKKGRAQPQSRPARGVPATEVVKRRKGLRAQL